MKSKKQTPLGYLMGLLGVSLKDLSEYVYVAQTSVSKWKTGARVLRPDSQHFVGIIGYFLALSCDVEKGDKLRRLFGRIYPSQPHDAQEDLALCLRAFLGGKLLPTAALAFSLDERGKLYSAQFSVYSGEEGLKAALAQMLLFASQMDVPSTVSLLDAQLVALDARALAVLTQGHRIRLLVSKETLLPVCGALPAVLSHPNLELRLLEEHAPLPPGVLFAAAGNGMALVSSAFDGQPRYTAIHMDELTVAQYTARFSRLWTQAVTPFEDIAAGTLTARTCRAALAAAAERRIDWIVPSLPHLTMRRELLMEVLEGSGASGHSWSRVLGCFDAARDFRLRLLVPVDAVRGMTEPLKELSMLAGTQSRRTNAQHRRHLLDTAALLRRGERAELLLLQQRQADILPMGSVFVWRNVLAGYLDFSSRTVRVTRHPALVEGCMRGMDALASEFTKEMLSPPYVAGLLESAALEMV